MRQSLAMRLGCAAFAFFLACSFTVSILADEPPKFRYGFQKGQKYGYDVQVTLKCMELQETWKGVLVYDVSQSTDEQFVAKVNGRLAESIQGTGRLPFFPMRGMRFGPRGFMGVQQPSAWTLTRVGDVVIVGRVNQIPCLLGPEELLVIEPLPKDAKNEWKINHGIGVLERGESSFGPPRASETGHGAGEQIEYTVTKTTPDVVQLTKKYHLSTDAAISGETKLSMSGDGQLTFDRKRGVFASNSMKYEIQLDKGGVKINVPVTLAYHLLSDKDLADHEKKEAERVKAIAEENRPKPIDPKERASLLRDLHSRDQNRCQAALKRFGRAVASEHPEVVSNAVTPYLHHPNDFVQADAAKALTVWATPNAEAALIAASRSENWMVRGPAVESLGRIHTASAAEAAAAALPRNRNEAGKALRAMGPVAEAATIPWLKDRDFWVRGEACDVLKEVGGQKSIAALRRELVNQRDMDKRKLEETISGIQFRMSQQGAEPDATETAKSEEAAEPAKAETPAAKSNNPAVRKWTDASGSFEIEAQYLGVTEGKVSLKKSTGRVIHVPLDKLSDDDQAWIKAHPRPKVENPFE